MCGCSPRSAHMAAAIGVAYHHREMMNCLVLVTRTRRIASRLDVPVHLRTRARWHGGARCAIQCSSAQVGGPLRALPTPVCLLGQCVRRAARHAAYCTGG